MSRFGTLKGFEGIKPRKPLELQLYVVTQAKIGGPFGSDDPSTGKLKPAFPVVLMAVLG